MSVCVYPRPSRSMGSPRRHGSPGIDLLSSFLAGSKKILRAIHGGALYWGSNRLAVELGGVNWEMSAKNMY